MVFIRHFIVSPPPSPRPPSSKIAKARRRFSGGDFHREKFPTAKIYSAKRPCARIVIVLFDQNVLAAARKNRIRRFFGDTIRSLSLIPQHRTRLFSRFFQFFRCTLAGGTSSSSCRLRRKLSHSSILSLTAEMCKNESISMNRAEGMVRRQIMKTPCRHLLEDSVRRPLSIPSSVSLSFPGKFLPSVIFTMDILGD